MKLPGTAGYEEMADELIAPYETLTFGEVHAAILDLLPAEPVHILDIGAGTGRDAAHFANLGHEVTAVEPTDNFRLAGRRFHSSSAIEWIDDGLPDLAALAGRAGTYDLIMLTAVWMHQDAAERVRAMPTLVSLMRSGGLLILSLRHGPVPEGRLMYDVTAAETIRLAEAAELTLIRERQSESIQPGNRAKGVRWTTLAFNKTV